MGAPAQKKSMSDRDDIAEMQRLFWLKYDGQITQEELERETERICDKQLILPSEEVYGIQN